MTDTETKTDLALHCGYHHTVLVPGGGGDLVGESRFFRNFLLSSIPELFPTSDFASAVWFLGFHQDGALGRTAN
eukprot:1393735-Amorphochlora_amoeboformis.AAC.1